MAKARRKRGTLFEQRTASIVQALSPAAQVQHNVFIVGRLSRVKRQFDVGGVDPIEYRYILFECKDHRRPLDVEIVDAFVGKLRDIGGDSRAALVSNSGYTTAAMSMAEAAGIECLELVDTRDSAIRAELKVTVLVRDLYVADLGLLRESVERWNLPTRLPEIRLRDSQAREVTAAHVLIDAWNSMRIPHRVGSHRFTFRAFGFRECATRDGTWIPADDVGVGVEVRERCWLGHLGILNSEGLYNTLDRTYATTSLTTEALDVEDLPRWRQVEPKTADMLAVTITQHVSTPLALREEV